MWKNTAETGRLKKDNNGACALHAEATNTLLDYVIFIAATLQQWLQEHSSILRYTYVACHVL